MENNRSTIIGVMLISLLIMALFWNQANKAALEEEAQETEEQVLPNTNETSEEETTPETPSEIVSNEEIAVLDSNEILNEEELKAQAKYGGFYKFVSGNEEEFTLENGLLKVEVSSLGAQVKGVELKDFLTFSKEPLQLIQESQKLDLLFVNDKNNFINLSDLYYIGTKTGESLSLKADLGDGAFVEHVYSLNDSSYLVDYDLHLVGMDDYIPSKNTSIQTEWSYTAMPQERDLSREKQKSTAYWKLKGDDVEHLGVGKSKTDDFSTSVDWVSFKQQFFNTALMSKSKFERGTITSTIEMDDSSSVAMFEAKMYMPLVYGSDNLYELQYYFGPNDYQLLKKVIGRDMHEVVELSADFFLFRWVSVINKWVIIPIFNFLERFIGNYGIIILILTLIIKMALMPLTFKSYVSTAKQKLLKPELDALKEKHKDDQQKYAAAQMALYQKTGVSMFGGCLPTLLQMPILLAMFYFFPSSIELRQESFLWAQDLSTFDTVPFLTWGFNFPILGSHLSPFTLLMTLSSLLMAKFNTQMQSQNTQPGMEMMKYMPYIFPFFLLFLFNTWPAALTYYYFLSNMISFGQQFAIKKFFIDEEKLKAQLEANKKKPVKKKSGFAARLEDVYKQQQQAQQKQKKGKK